MVSGADAQGAARAVAGLLTDGHREPLTRLSHRDHALQPVHGRSRHHPRHHHRRAPGLGRRQRGGHPASRDLHHAAHLRNHSSDFDLLGRAFRRGHHLDTFQHPRRAVVGGDDFRRLPDGAAGAGRPGADRRVHLLLRRRLFLDRADHVLRAAPGRDRSQVRAAGILRHSTSHFLQFRRARRRQPAQVAGIDSHRLHPRHRRPRHRHRPAAPHLRHYRAHERLRFHHRRHRPVRHRRDPAERRGRAELSRHEDRHEPARGARHLENFAALLAHLSCAAPSSASGWDSSPAARRRRRS